MAKTGRPSKYTPELGQQICERIAKGELLIDIAGEDGMPAWRTLMDWLSDNPERNRPEFAHLYARAKVQRLERMADELIKLADTPQPGERTKVGPNGTEITTGDMIEHRRLQVDTRKWLLARLMANVYGDRIQQQVTGADGQPLIPTTVNIRLIDGPEKG